MMIRVARQWFFSKGLVREPYSKLLLELPTEMYVESSPITYTFIAAMESEIEAMVLYTYTAVIKPGSLALRWLNNLADMDDTQRKLAFWELSTRLEELDVNSKYEGDNVSTVATTIYRLCIANALSVSGHSHSEYYHLLSRDTPHDHFYPVSMILPSYLGK